MRKSELIKFFSISFVLVFVSHIGLFAQQDQSAGELLKQVSKKYDSYQTIRSDFSFKVSSPDQKNYQDKGIMSFDKKTNSYRIELESQTLISDGKTVWSIIDEDKEVQITDADTSSENIGPNNIFTFYKSGFKYLSLEDETLADKKVLKVVDLSPIDTRKNYFKIRIRINANLHIHDVQIFDKSGARYTYSISALYVNHSIPSSTFTFKKSNYPSYEIVDLR